LPDGASKIFFTTGLDRGNQLEVAAENSFCARGFGAKADEMGRILASPLDRFVPTEFVIASGGVKGVQEALANSGGRRFSNLGVRSRISSQQSVFFAHSLGIRLPADFRRAVSALVTQSCVMVLSSADISCRLQIRSKSILPSAAQANHATE